LVEGGLRLRLLMDGAVLVGLADGAAAACNHSSFSDRCRKSLLGTARAGTQAPVLDPDPGSVQL
jgi:hypothetical protein